MYNRNDPILDLQEPHPYAQKANQKQEKKVASCYICEKEQPKKSAQCQFCALWGCSNCISKMYPFPVIEKELKLGVICLVCETKLNIQEVTHDIWCKIRQKESEFSRKESEVDRIERLRALTNKKLDQLKREKQDLLRE